jgi:hypothetical protein
MNNKNYFSIQTQPMFYICAALNSLMLAGLSISYNRFLAAYIITFTIALYVGLSVLFKKVGKKPDYSYSVYNPVFRKYIELHLNYSLINLDEFFRVLSNVAKVAEKKNKLITFTTMHLEERAMKILFRGAILKVIDYPLFFKKILGKRLSLKYKIAYKRHVHFRKYVIRPDKIDEKAFNHYASFFREAMKK